MTCGTHVTNNTWYKFTSGTVPEDELVADLLEELWGVALLPLDELDDLEPGPALRLALLVLGVAPGMQMKP